MSRFKEVNSERIPLTAEEETARDAEEAAWLAEVQKPQPPTLEQRLAIVEAVVLQGKTVQQALAEAAAAAANVVHTGKLP